MIRGFTLIEVLVSVFLVMIIGLTLTKVSSQNINTIQVVKDDRSFLHSAVVTSIHEYRDINDYIKINDIPKYDYFIEKKKTFLSSSAIALSDDFIIEYTTQKESIKSANGTQAFFRIK